MSGPLRGVSEHPVHITSLVSASTQTFTDIELHFAQEILAAKGQVKERSLEPASKDPVDTVLAEQVAHINAKMQSQDEIKIASSNTLPVVEKMDAKFVKKVKSDQEIAAYCNKIKALNPDHPSHKLFQNIAWNPSYFNEENLPINLGQIEMTALFSSKNVEGPLRILDLPIHMPGQGWKIPTLLSQFKEVIAKAIEYERVVNPNFEDYSYVYITVDQGDVQPHTRQRRAGWHGDSYRHVDAKDVDIGTDHLYVIANACPTLFVPGPFPFNEIDPTDVDEVLAHFAKIADTQTPVTFPDNTLLMMDPYCVHDAGLNQTSTPIFRTFVKISVSKVQYCKLGNERNPLFDYDWAMVPRHCVPYTKEVLAESSHRKDRDNFLEIDPKEIDFTLNRSKTDWASGDIFTCKRSRSVLAQPAKEGEILASCVDGFIITYLVAGQDDWKVTTKDSDQYFLSSAKMKTFYTQNTKRENEFFPKGEMRRAVALTQDVRYKAPWGTLSYAKKGDYLVYLNADDVYTVPKGLFEKDYKKIES